MSADPDAISDLTTLVRYALHSRGGRFDFDEWQSAIESVLGPQYGADLRPAPTVADLEEIRLRRRPDKTPAEHRAARAAGPVAWIATSADGNSEALFFNHAEAVRAAGPGGSVRPLR